MVPKHLSLELNKVLKHTEEDELSGIADSDPEIGRLVFEMRRRRELLHIELNGLHRHGSAVPRSVHGYLYGKGIGYLPLRTARTAA